MDQTAATTALRRSPAGFDDALDAAASAVRSGARLALTCHHHPDGDALGSVLAFERLCRLNGVDACASWAEPHTVAPHYRFLPGLDTAVTPDRFPRRPDVMVTFDASSPARLGGLAPAAAAARELVVVDHHVDNGGFGDVDVLDPSAAATAMIVADLADRLGWELDRQVAVCLYTALVTDTGRFRYPNTDAAVFGFAQRLAGFDIPISDIEWHLFDRHSFSYLRLAADVVANADLDADHHLVSATCTSADQSRFGVTFDETEALIDTLRQTAEADVACIVREDPDGRLWVSLRSTGNIDVGEVAGALGGGGHKFMAGFQTRRPLAEVRRDVADALADRRR